MKKIILIAAIFMSFYSKAESIMSDYYIVVSDVFDADVKPGTCLLTGKTIDVNNLPISGGTVSNFDRSRSVVSDSKGIYSVVLSVKDTAVFFYHENYGEVVIWKYNFQSQHRVEINFISAEYSELPVSVEKPVIYLYSDIETDVNLTLKHDQLTFTYPDYNHGWSVTTNSDGGITNQSDGKKYPYLFWEGETKNLSLKNQNGSISGAFIHTDSTISFLENSLTALGLNSTEQTDFITYWGPRIMKEKFAFIQFLTDDEVDETIAELTISPKPANQRRVYLLFMPLEQPQVPFDFTAQNFTGFQREGLTVVEWGGSELMLRKILP